MRWTETTDREFTGDLLLIETPDGGDCVLRDGLLSADRTFGTAFYLSLFGGNKADSGKVKNKHTWWGNMLAGVTEKEKIISRFQNFITGTTMTVKNIKNAEEAARQDLKWAVDEGIVDKINITGRTEGKNRFRLYIQALKAEELVYESNYGVLWGAGINGGI
jgi:phage gp46-like protein